MNDFDDQVLIAAEVPLIRVGKDGERASCNRAAEGVLGEHLAGHHFSAVFRDPTVIEKIEHTLNTSQPNQAEYVRRKGGLPIKYLASARALPKGRALLTLVDNSAEHAAGTSRSEFVANVSHELRTPLMAITGLIETLQGPAKEDPKAQEHFLQLMGKEAERMNRLVGDLLSLSQVESEEMRDFQPVDVCDVIASAIAGLSSRAAERGIKLQFNECKVRNAPVGNREQIRQVFLNLIENAIKYGAGDSTVTIEVHEQTYAPVLGRDCVQIDVRDIGAGIAAQHLARLTERFYRVDSHRSSDTGGTGLGLAIVKHIIKGHRGYLRISSDVGKGSCFSVYLPVF